MSELSVVTGHCHSEAVRKTGVTAVPGHSDLAGVRCGAEGVITDLCGGNRQQSQECGNLERVTS